MKLSDFSVRIAGLAGDGSLLAGEILAFTLKRRGLYVVSVKDFPSNIRGLPTNLTIRANLKRIYSWGDHIDSLVAFEPKAIKIHPRDLKKGGVIIVDEEIDLKDIHLNDIYIYSVPLKKRARELFKREIFKNVIALGFLGYIYSIDPDEFKNTIVFYLKAKDEKIVESNIRALTEGYVLAEKIVKERFQIERGTDSGRYFLSGNEAVALGAIAAGCRFFAAYPITPSTEVFEFLSKHLPKYGGVTVQGEDEIASINMAIGASFAGIRSMTATSGPGMALKVEALSLASMAEVPLVIYHAQRAGPSTGIPTKTSQEDINHILFAGHGDVSRIVLVPSTPEESFEFTFKAFNLAEKYQIPVIVLSEQAISQNQQTIDDIPYDENYTWERGKILTDEMVLSYMTNGKPYERYEITEDGISLRGFPGQKGIIVRYNSNEKTPEGFIDEECEYRNEMVEKRIRKFENIINELPFPELYGREEAKNVLIGIGSSLGPMREAVDRLNEEKLDFSYLRIRSLFPLHEDYIYSLTFNKNVFVCELNSFSQLRNYLSRIWGKKENVFSLRKYIGLPFKPSEIVREIKKIIKGEG
ncbi:MAG: 2-oxoacid:acceptor oxidoreductase subunit alpha [Candidatus Hydrothermales bacterium]